jgi:hypothetical protein
VIDGDTVSVSGAAQHIRLVGFNAPETYKPLCAAEAERGAEATRRLTDIIASGDLTLTRVTCSCPAGTEGSFACNYGRACGSLNRTARTLARC